MIDNSTGDPWNGHGHEQQTAASPPETMPATGPTFHQVQQVLRIGPVTFTAVNTFFISFNGQLAISEGPFMVIKGFRFQRTTGFVALTLRSHMVDREGRKLR